MLDTARDSQRGTTRLKGNNVLMPIHDADHFELLEWTAMAQVLHDHLVKTPQPHTQE